MKTISLMLCIGLMTLMAVPRSSLLWTASAFSLSSPPSIQLSRRKASIQTRRSSASSVSTRRSTTYSRSLLFMSDIPEDNNKQRRKQQQEQRSPPPSTNNDKDDDDGNNTTSDTDLMSYWTAFLKPPPKPEDQLVMLGDIFSLFIYSITDHLICQSLSHYTLWQAANDPQKLHSIVHSLAETSAQSAAVFSTPVWLEDVTSANSPAVLHVLHDQVASQLVTHYYSPLLEPTGMATCVLAGTWLFAGWLNRAFLFRNTLNCPTSQALIVTGRTWIVTAAILLLATMMSSAVMANNSIGGGGAIVWTRGDLDFIFGSLTVVALWRFLFSYILGGGGGTTDSSDNDQDKKNRNGKK